MATEGDHVAAITPADAANLVLCMFLLEQILQSLHTEGRDRLRRNIHSSIAAGSVQHTTPARSDLRGTPRHGMCMTCDARDSNRAGKSQVRQNCQGRPLEEFAARLLDVDEFSCTKVSASAAAVRVFPVPGGPWTSVTGCRHAARTASSWESLRWKRDRSGTLLLLAPDQWSTPRRRRAGSEDEEAPCVPHRAQFPPTRDDFPRQQSVCGM